MLCELKAVLRKAIELQVLILVLMEDVLCEDEQDNDKAKTNKS